MDNYLDQHSVLGRTSDAILEGAGQAAAIVGLGGFGAGAGLGTTGTTALTTGASFVSGAGSGRGEAYQGGATDAESRVYGTISGAADAITELIFGGLGKSVKAVGIGKGLTSADDMLAKTLGNKVSKVLSKVISNEKVLRAVGNTAELGVKMSAEGMEEVLAGLAQAVGKKVTYMSEEDMGKIIQDENLLEQFLVGAATSGIMQGGDLHRANKTGTDLVTGFTRNEQAVIDKEVENRIAQEEKAGKKLSGKEKSAIYEQVVKDMERGYISTETIESVLGKDALTQYDALSKEAEEFKTLYETEGGKLSEKQKDRLAELKEKNKANPYEDLLKSQREKISKDVSALAQSDRLGESYKEQIRKGEKFQADVSEYSEAQRKTVQNAIDSGILNNTNRSHEFVDLIAKISADKGISFDFADNAKLKESGFALDGVLVNGFVNENGVTINVQSAKALNRVVGHEITHVLEGTELYDTLQSAVTEYAKTKKEYNRRLKELTELYEGKNANVEQELVADLVGDYLFTDADFIKHLSTANRNLFQKIYDEIKYLCKIVKAGTKEARQLEKVKKAFADAYRAKTKNPTKGGGVKYSLGQYSDAQKENWKNSKKIVIYENDAQLLQFVKESIANKDAANKMYFGIISGDLAKRIKADTGLDFNGKNAVLRAMNVRKILLHDHGNVESEKLRGQVAVTETDFLAIKDIFGDPDTIKPEPQGYNGKPAATFEKVIGDKKYTMFVVDSGGSLDIFVQTMYIHKQKGSIANVANAKALTSTPEATVGTAPTTNVQQNNPGVKQQFSLSSAENVKAAEQHFGTTYKISEAGYLLTDGNLLDFSGRHEGAPGGYRTVDHRDITDALDEDYGGDNYSDGMIRFMGEGNIRLSPESGGINLSVKPNKAQLSTLDRYISNFRGEVILDIDDANGNTVVSIEYPKRTYSKRIINDINAYFDEGKIPEQPSDLGQFRYSLSKKDFSIAPPVGADVHGKDIGYDIAPPVPESVKRSNKARPKVGDPAYAPIAEGYSRSVRPEESVGAAKQNFTGRAAYQDLLTDKNSQRDRPGDVRQVEVPKVDGYGRKISEFVGNAYGSEVVPDEFTSTIEELVQEGALGYDPKTNAQSLQEAAQRIKDKGKASIRNAITKNIANGKVGDTDIATAMVLFNQYAHQKGKDAQESAAELMVDLQMMATQTGRDLQLFKMFRKMTPQGQLMTVTKTVQKYVENINKRRSKKQQVEVEIPAELQNDYMEAAQEAAVDNTPENQERREEAEIAIYEYVASQIPATLEEKWDAWRYMAMLGNPKTQIRNVVGNAVFLPFVRAKRHIGAALESVFLEQENRTKGILGTEGRELLAWAKKDAKAQETESRMEYTGTTGDSAASEIGDRRKIFNSELLEKGRTGLNWLMGWEDMQFKRHDYAVAMASFLKARGVTAQQLESGNVESDTLNAARDYAVQEAMKATFNDQNAVSDFVSNLRYKGNNGFAKAINAVGEGILPFRRTPANIVVRGLEYSPVGLAATILADTGKLRRGEMSGAEYIDKIAAGLTGSAALAIGYALASGIFGAIRLVGVEDDEDEKRVGHQSYALEVGDTSITIDWAAPSALPLFMGTNLYSSLNPDAEEVSVSVFTAFLDSALNTLEPMLELSCLSSLNDLLTDTRYAEEGRELYTIATSAATSYFTQGLPTLFGQIERTGESENRMVYADSSDPVIQEMQQVIGQATQKIPGVDLFQAERVDAWGQVQEKPNLAVSALDAFLNPSKVKEIEENPVDVEISRLNSVPGGENVSPQTPDKKISYTDSYGVDHNRRLSAEEYVALAKAQGQKQRELVEAAISAKEYGLLSDTEKATVIKNIYKYAKEYARGKVINGYADDYGCFSTKWMSEIYGDVAEEIIWHTIDQRD